MNEISEKCDEIIKYIQKLEQKLDKMDREILKKDPIGDVFANQIKWIVFMGILIVLFYISDKI